MTFLTGEVTVIMTGEVKEKVDVILRSVLGKKPSKAQTIGKE